jgi:hypothetical protein
MAEEHLTGRCGITPLPKPIRGYSPAQLFCPRATERGMTCTEANSRRMPWRASALGAARSLLYGIGATVRFLALKLGNLTTVG